MKVVKNINGCLVAGCICAIVGCSTLPPEKLAQSERDKMTYTDKGSVARRNDASFRIAVCVDQKDYERHPTVGDAIEAQMAEAISRFKMFHFVERSRINALAAERMFQGQSSEASALLKSADCLLSVKLNVSTEEFAVRLSDYTGEESSNKYGTHLEKRWRLHLRPDFRLYEVDTCKVVLTKSYESSIVLPAKTLNEARGNVEVAVMNAMQAHTKEFSTLLTSRYAPPARILQTRGGGKVAQISIGADYGVQPNMSVEFFSYEDNSDLVVGGERSMNTIGYGRVLEGIGPKSAWVEVADPATAQVMRGHYARIREGQAKVPEESPLERFFLVRILNDLAGAFFLPSKQGQKKQ